MSIDYDEKRDFRRMAAQHALQFRNLEDGEEGQGTCINLSATGILFSADQPLPTGTRLQIEMTPPYAVVAPFDAEVEVVRATPREEGGYEIAGRIVRMD